MDYMYPKLDKNWDFWILLQKVYDALGTRPDTNNWFTGFSSGGETIIVHASRELTSEEKSKLDSVMADPASGLYPASQTGYTVLEIKDIYDSWKTLETTLGIKIKYVFANTPRHDYIELWVEGTLTTTQKKRLMDEYARLIKERII